MIHYYAGLQPNLNKEPRILVEDELCVLSTFYDYTKGKRMLKIVEAIKEQRRPKKKKRRKKRASK